MDAAALSDALAGLRPVLIKLARLQLRNDTSSLIRRLT